jgi:hypothetical protein
LSAIKWRLALGPTMHSCPMGIGVKQGERKADHSPPSSAEVKNACSFTSISQYGSVELCLGTGTTSNFVPKRRNEPKNLLDGPMRGSNSRKTRNATNQNRNKWLCQGKVSEN